MKLGQPCKAILKKSECNKEEVDITGDYFMLSGSLFINWIHKLFLHLSMVRQCDAKTIQDRSFKRQVIFKWYCDLLDGIKTV